MTVFFTGSVTTGFSVTSNDDFYVTLAGDTVSNTLTGFDFLTSTGNEYTLFGNVLSQADGVVSTGMSSENTVFVAEGATIFAGTTGVTMSGVSGHSVINEGSIIGNGNSGIRMNATGANVTNDGHVYGKQFGIVSFGTDTRVANNGTIDSQGTGISIPSRFAETLNTGTITAFVGINAQFSGGVTNTGTIIAGNTGVILNPDSDSEITLFNSGTISGEVIGVVMVGPDTTAENLLVNSGTIGATRDISNTFSAAVFGDLSKDTVQNSGSINGDVLLGANDDKVVNTGTITGDVSLGADADTFIGRGDGVVSGVVDGQGGSDTLIGSVADDDFRGGNGADELRGRQGDDSLDGGTGADDLAGGRGNDTLIGDAGNDTLLGGAGNDTLNGGAGRDVMNGGADADSFVFTDIADSATNNSRDVIRDFQKGQDKIDIDALSMDEFAFIGSDAFTGMGDAEVRVTVNSSGNSIVRVDADGDGTTDTSYLVRGVDNLDAGDFIL